MASKLEAKKVLNPLNSPVWILRFGHYWANKLCWADKPIGPKDETIQCWTQNSNALAKLDLGRLYIIYQMINYYDNQMDHI